MVVFVYFKIIWCWVNLDILIEVIVDCIEFEN